MRVIPAEKIKNTVERLCIKANQILRGDVLTALKSARQGETNQKARQILDAIIKNASVARKERLAICQDTGMPCVFIELGQNVKISGDFKKAVNRGIKDGYQKGSLRNSIIVDPLLRKSPGYTPAVIHTDIVKGDKVKITVLPKGFGCENKSQLKMFLPTANIEEVKRFIVEAAKLAGADACPPYIIGVGIGGTADYACFLAKKALLKNIHSRRSLAGRRLEIDLLKELNKLNIGPMGLGGKTTALGVNILTYPTHIAGLPVAVNISCHALRSATAQI